MIQNLKIAVLIPEFPGQTHSFFWREIEALRQYHGIKAQIISTRLPPRPVLHDWVAEAAAIQLHPMSAGRMALLAPRVIAALPKLMADPDIGRLMRRPRTWGFILIALHLAQICKDRGLSHLHVHSCANFALIAALCSRISGIPYSLVLHGPLSDYGPDQPIKWRGAETVFVITKTLLSDVARVMPQMLNKVRVSPMGVNTDALVPPVTPRLDYPEIFTWFCCGRLNRVKGHDILVKAAAMVRAERPNMSFRIRIAGEDDKGGSGYRRDIEGVIAQENADNLVQLLGSVTQDQIVRELQEADGFVLASRNEALGVAYMEAMACALPVIGTNAGGVSELINTEHDGVLVNPEDPRAVADAMIRLMADPELRRRMGAAARDKVLADFSARRSADALAITLKDIP